MRIVTLGTSAGKPTPKRSASASALEFEGEVLLFDCGEGTQVQLAKSTLSWGSIKAIFIGHLHGDHVNGLPGLLATMSMSDRKEALSVFGPPGIKKYLKLMQEIKNSYVSYPLEIHEIKEAGLIFESQKYKVFTAKLDHLVECWGYRFEEKDRPGFFDEEKAKALQIPIGRERAELVKGKSITLESGKIIHPSEVVGPKRPGRKVAYCLDTRPCAGDLELAYECDVLIHEATFDASMSNEMHLWGHSTTTQAAKVAKQAQVKQLVLTHISPRYTTSKELLKEAKDLFHQTQIAYDLNEYPISWEQE